jgi:hypothetical protein
MTTNKGGTQQSPRLTIELVPLRSWQRNVRAVVAQDTWDALRWYFGATEERPRYLNIAFPLPLPTLRFKCKYCGVEGQTLHLHEEWRYDDNNKVQQLVGLRPICSMCHLAKHMGCANEIGRTDEALAHLAKVNDWTSREAMAYIKRAFAVWHARATIEYTLDLSYLERYIPSTKIHLDWLDKPRTWVGTRLDAILWAKRLLDSDTIIVDTETTGLLDKADVEVIELAAINTKGKLIYHSLYKPIHKIPSMAMKIHGITNREVKSCPTFFEQAGSVTAALQGKIIVTYNAKFDREVLARTFKLNGLAGISARWECAMHTFRVFSGSGKYLPLGRKHRAVEDCKATLRLIRRMAKGIP